MTHAPGAGWHVDRDTLASYARSSLSEAIMDSLEAHLLQCPSCRRAVAQFVPDEHLERMWSAVTLEVNAPRQQPLERFMVRAGLPDHMARLVAATRSLRLSWLAAVAVALGFSALAAYTGSGGLLMFLIVAPLVPVAGVATAYGPHFDPAHEVGIAAPMSSFRLLMIRAVGVVVTSTAVALVASLALPELGWTAAAWMLPALALTATSLALSSFIAPVAACAGIAFAWIAGVVLSEFVSSVPLVAFRTAGQLAFGLAVVVATVVVTRRRELFEKERYA